MLLNCPIRRVLVSLAGILALVLPGMAAADEPQQRHVQLTGRLTLRDLPPATQVAVWMPEPQSSSVQQVHRVIRRADFDLSSTREPGLGNTMLHAVGNSPRNGQIEFEVSWAVQRSEVRPGAIREEGRLSEQQRQEWLRGTKRVPVGGRPLQLVDQGQLPTDTPARARFFYDLVLSHMTYDKSRPGYGTGDAVWACDSRFGNCTDFHSLFNSLARSHGIPARFEIGYSLPTDQDPGILPGYHCWAWFYETQSGWQPVDISEADKHPERTDDCFGRLSADRVAFSVGRELMLEPPQQGPPLNYFVAPYVELDGQPADERHQKFTLDWRPLEPSIP